MESELFNLSKEMKKENEREKKDILNMEVTFEATKIINTSEDKGYTSQT